MSQDIENTDAVESVSVVFRSDTAFGSGSQNTRLLIGGHDITRFCRLFQLSASVGDIVTATIEVLPRQGFDLALPAGVVALTVIAPPGFVLIEEESPCCQKRWRVEPEEKSTK